MQEKDVVQSVISMIDQLYRVEPLGSSGGLFFNFLIQNTAFLCEWCNLRGGTNFVTPNTMQEVVDIQEEVIKKAKEILNNYSGIV